MTNECWGFILQETQQKCLQGLIGQQTARQPMEKYNVHLTSKSEKKINAKILKLIIKPIAKVSFLGNQHPLPFGIVSIQAICIQSDFGIMHNTPKNNAFTKVCFASLNIENKTTQIYKL